MNAADEDISTAPPRSRARFEAIFASVWTGFGLLILPALIYWVGGLLLGPYGENVGLGRFYGDFFADLAEPSVRAWLLLLGPGLTVYALRLIFRSHNPQLPVSPEETPPSHPVKPAAPRRVEPRIGAE